MNQLNLVVTTIVEVVPPKIGKWVGLALIALGWYLPRLFALDSDMTDWLYPAGVALILAAGSKLANAGAERRKLRRTVRAKVVPAPPAQGFAHIGALILAALVGALALLASGCGSLERRQVHTETAPEVVLDDTSGRCIARGYADGHELLTLIGPVGALCPEVEVVTRPAPGPVQP